MGVFRYLSWKRAAVRLSRSQVVTLELCPGRRPSDLNPRFDLQPDWMSALPCYHQPTIVCNANEDARRLIDKHATLNDPFPTVRIELLPQIWSGD